MMKYGETVKCLTYNCWGSPPLRFDGKACKRNKKIQTDTDSNYVSQYRQCVEIFNLFKKKLIQIQGT